MFIKKMSLHRRTFLRGMGTVIALPLLDAMVPAIRAGAAGIPAPRFGVVYIANGAIMEQWIPEKVGIGFEFTPILKPLEPYGDAMTVVTNLTRSHPGSQVGDHAVSAAGFLTGVWPKRTEGEDVFANTTIDQIVAKQIGQDTPFPSLEVATEDFTGYVGACSPGFNCSYMNTVSWSSPTTPLPMDINPRVVFERMFGEAGSAAARAARRRDDRSILDSIGEEANRLQRGLGARDRTRVREYLDNLREIERRIQRAEAHAGANVTLDAPIGVPDSFEEHAGLMYDLMALAFEGDITRSITLMLGRDLTGQSFPESGFNGGWHGSSHHGDKPENIAQYAKINRYHVQNLAKFVEKLHNTPEGDGTILDHVLIYKGTNMGNSHRHAHEKVPVELIGGIDGTFKGNRHIVFPDNVQRCSNMLLSLLDLYGIHRDSLGDSTGRLPGLG